MDGFQIARDMLARDYTPTRETMRGPTWESRIANAATSAVFKDVAAIAQPPAWHAEAACKGAPADLFFSGAGENAKVKEAKAICAGCNVRQECLDEAVARSEKFGVWGGKSERQRRSMRETRRQAS